ncbi:MAG: TolC family protein [Bacteroides sp.]|nr:TolC family protein [Bacteroides sp.]
MKKIYLPLIIMALSCTSIHAQETWDLQRCIYHAIEHNLTIKQKEAEREQSEVELNTAQWSRLPNLSGNVGQSFNFGRALQADNTYGNRNTRNTNFSLGSNIPLFTGMQIPNNIALGKLNLKAATEDLEKAKEDISIQVTSQFLQILYNEELLKVARNQVQLSQELLDKKITFFKHGKASEAEVLEAKSRLAQDKLSAVQADNNHQLALLELSQLLELPSPENFQICTPIITDISVDIALPEDIYEQALMVKPAIKAAQYRLLGAEKSIRIARSAFYPQLSFGVGIDTNYYYLSEMENVSFGTQWNQNMNKYFQLSLSIPLFNRFQTGNRVKKARIQRASLSWQLEESKKALYKDIQQAYYNALASESKFKSSLLASESAEASFLLMSEKYTNGKATATEYNEMRASWMKALSDGIQAKYEFLYCCKILDFYKGLPLKL